MRPEELRQFIRSEPLRPFPLTLTDARTHDVQHPELVVLGRSSVLIGFPRQDDPELVYDEYAITSLLHVMQAQPVDAAVSPGSFVTWVIAPMEGC